VDIHINSYPVNIELENEKNIADVLSSVSRWAQARDFIFVEALIDDVSYPVDQVPDLGIEKVERVNCIVQSRADAVISSIEEAMRYADRVVSFAASPDSGDGRGLDQARALSGGADWMVDMVSSVLSLLGAEPSQVPSGDRDLSGLMKDLRELADRAAKITENEIQPLADRAAALFAEMNNVFRTIMLSENLKNLVIQSLDSPDALIDGIMEIKSSLSAQMENLLLAAGDYGAGRDAEASEKLQSFVDFIFRYTRTCYQAAPVFQVDLGAIAVDGVSLDDKNRAIQNLLIEMHGALENNDIISLSDVMEYELKPALENLEEYVDLLIEKISS